MIRRVNVAFVAARDAATLFDWYRQTLDAVSSTRTSDAGCYPLPNGSPPPPPSPSPR
jgi:hypothetical protein